MRSLSAHLRKPESHGQLPFHADCPICRQERLIGVLPPNRLVGVRAQAALAAGVLAFSSSAPAVAFAAEGDQEQVGSAVPGQAGGNDPALSPDFDPGGDSTDLPADAPLVPQVQAPQPPGDDDTALVEQEPSTDSDAPVVDGGDGSAPAAGEQQQAPTTSDTLAPAQPAPTTGSEQPPPATTPVPPTAPNSPPPATAPSETATPTRAAAPRVREHDTRSRARAERTRRAHPVRPHAVPAPAPAPSPSTPVAPATEAVSTSTRTPSVPAERRAQRGDRTHVVEPGESLWSIASDLLGRDASPAAIAREVHHLWQLNKERIGTGDPNLLMVGTRLVLR